MLYCGSIIITTKIKVHGWAVYVWLFLYIYLMCKKGITANWYAMKHSFAGGMDIQLVSHQLDCALRVAILFDNLAISVGHIALICVTFPASHHLDLHVRDTNIYSRAPILKLWVLKYPLSRCSCERTVSIGDLKSCWVSIFPSSNMKRWPGLSLWLLGKVLWLQLGVCPGQFFLSRYGLLDWKDLSLIVWCEI